MADRPQHQGRRLIRRALAGTLLAWLAGAGCAVAAELEALVRTPAGLPVADAAVVLEPLVPAPARPRRSATIEQIDREFRPYLTIIEKGTPVEFPNRDPFKHHVYSFSPPNVFEIKLYADKPAKPIVFDKAGIVVLGCNIHDWMEAHVLVVDTPWFAKTGEDGRARIEHVPAGAYRLRLWHPRQRRAVADSPVDLNGSRRLDLGIDVEPRQLRKKPPLDADGY